MKIIAVDKISDGHYQIVKDGFLKQAINQAKIEKRPERLTLEMLDDDGSFIGMIACDIFYGCIYTDILFIEESYRGKGCGAKLLKQAEAIAKEKGATFATLQTMSWEAHDFYASLGYEVEFIRKGFEGGSFAYMMRKEL